ncbi:MAG: response regulator [Gammaproteobacteria bacterium]
MKRILFVDDESNILQGLKRMLRGQRKEWEMHFAESGKQALELMEHDHFDAIISDMRMPGMDGAELLSKVKEQHPNTVRFILSGHSDHELVMRSVGPSHQYLSKPCEPEVLKSTLADAFALRELLASESIRTLVAGMSSLPSLPTIYTAVVEQLQSEDASIHSIGNLIEQDPGMTAKVLQLVNSAYFGLGRHISSPSEAASFLGLDVIKGLVLSESVFSQFDEEVVKSASLEAIRSRCLHVATSARKIAKAECASDVVCDQAYLGGLLHDMGILVLASKSPDEYVRASELARQKDMDLYTAEKQVFGTTHAEIGAYMLGLWGIDDDVVASVAYHHKPSNLPNEKFSALTAVYVASTCVSGNTAPSDQSPFTNEDIAYLESIGLANRLPVWQELCLEPEEDAA